jgi:hypothetical protein
VQLLNLRTPLSTRTSSTFKVYTLDKSLFRINEMEQLLFVTMSEGADMGSVQATTSSNDVGADSVTLTLVFSSPVPVRATDLIVITIPDDI